MGTRSSIAVQHADGKVSQIYCHWDGYPEYVGRILDKHYNTLKRAEELVALGDLSSIGPVIGTKHDFDKYDKDQCTFYGRDRGEKDVEPEKFWNEKMYFLEGGGHEYNYFFTKRKWHLVTMPGVLVPLKKVLEAKKILEDIG